MAHLFANPFKPGAGHSPPYLAGRTKEINEFRELLGQKTILKNVILTGLRGVGKTVLLEKFKAEAINNKWLWVGTDLSESASLDEKTLCTRLIADMSLLTSNITFNIGTFRGIGIGSEEKPKTVTLSYEFLINHFDNTPGLIADKLKSVLELVWSAIKSVASDTKGLIFAYDEAQTIENHKEKEQYPVSLILDTFQSIQRKEIPFMLVLSGLPTLFPKLVEARTFAERMFETIFLNKLTDEESRQAILKPISDSHCPVTMSGGIVDSVIRLSGGYPYFIQFIGREIYDLCLQKLSDGKDLIIPINEIEQKLDKDFFYGRWAKATDRQRELLYMIAHLDSCDGEFSVHEVVEQSTKYPKKVFGNSQVNQMMAALINQGLLYKNRHGSYSFAVPLFAGFIKRNYRLDS